MQSSYIHQTAQGLAAALVVLFNAWLAHKETAWRMEPEVQTALQYVLTIVVAALMWPLMALIAKLAKRWGDPSTVTLPLTLEAPPTQPLTQARAAPVPQPPVAPVAAAVVPVTPAAQPAAAAPPKPQPAAQPPKV